MNNKEIRSTELSCWQRHFASWIFGRQFGFYSADFSFLLGRILLLADTMQLFSRPGEFVQRRCSPKVSTCPSPDFFSQFYTPLHSRIVSLLSEQEKKKSIRREMLSPISRISMERFTPDAVLPSSGNRFDRTRRPVSDKTSISLSFRSIFIDCHLACHFILLLTSDAPLPRSHFINELAN